MKKQCSVAFCEKIAKEKSWCSMHAQRYRRYGDLNYVTPEEERRKSSRLAQPNLGKLKQTTYKKLFGRHEHRVVAEMKLGRPLQKGEVVHHIDGNKHNNSPGNLEIISQSKHINEHRKELTNGRRLYGSKITHCPKGHEYSIENTYKYEDGRRQCITCRKVAYIKWKSKCLEITK